MVKGKVDLTQFRKTMKDYRQISKRTWAEIINAKLFFIARNAVNETDKVPPPKMDSELDAPARDYPKSPLAAVIINSRQKKKGEKGLTGKKMIRAIDKMKKARHKARAFLASGWLPAIRILENALKRGDISFVKRRAPRVDSSVKQKGQDKGTGVWAKPNVNKPWGEIENAVQGDLEGKTTGRVQGLLTKALNKAIRQEVASMEKYIALRMKPDLDKVNR